MNEPIAPNKLKYLILGAGGIGLALRTILYATGVDNRGLLESFHWARILLVALTLAVAGFLFLKTRCISGPADPMDAFPQSLTAGVGCIPAGIMILVTTLTERAGLGTPLGLLALILGAAAGIAMLDVAVCRIRGTQPQWLMPTLICVYFTFRTVMRYRVWSSHPQMQDYIFYLGAYIALMLASYYHAAFAAHMGSHRPLWITSLAAVFLCCLCLTYSQDKLLLLSCGIWMFTGLSSLTPRPRRQMPSMNLEDAP